MEKRFQVFVSSTYEDLLDERQEVMQALLELDCIPAGMELFPATNDDQWSLIKKVIDESDYYLVIVGGRYGSLSTSGKSFTQMEYEYALEINKPIIGFVHKNPGDLPAKKTESDPKINIKLENFKEIIKQKLIRYWETPEGLGSVVSRSMIKLIKSDPAIGWVKADQLPDEDLNKTILELRNEIGELQSELKTYKDKKYANSEELAQDKDIFEVKYSFRSYSLSDSGYRETIQRFSHSYSISWNQLFFSVSPYLVDEASESKIIESLNELTEKTNFEFLSKTDQLKDVSFDRFKVSSDAFNSIIVQFIALGYIKKSSKGKSVKDKATYWSLTDTGELKMISLLRNSGDTILNY
jgi:hypothetical protein